MEENVIPWGLSPLTWALLVLSSSFLVALLARALFKGVVQRLTRQTETELDDILARHLRRPVWLSIGLGGTWYALAVLDLPRPVPYVTTGLLATGVVVLWTVGISRIAGEVLEWLAERTDRFSAVSPRTMPVFEFGARAVVYGTALYFLFLAWNVDLTGWLASAGIVGIAVGFAARDTLANLFAGVFILADAPYKLGDYLILGSGERGRVTEIGIRATRILTRDDVEIIVPNAVMANVKIINESGGPGEPFRVRAKVDVAYGSDLDEVRSLLLAALEGVEGITEDPNPRVRFREFGSSGLRFQLLCWVHRPELRGRVLDAINSNIYKSFNANGIEIPYSRHDVYLHQRE
ncbi:MAG: mechanosensitive ion channel family protein [Deltaproteobacteria bacterium]|nr:mechanosensitive ion channel family protein [Deltaproteobacteria bacterium]MBW2254330.1 mechanosensitive ion channel family protein [Deltaproteobacteria bacterium]